MIRRLPTAAAAAAAALLAGAAVAQVKWDMPTPYADREVLTKNSVQFAADVNRASNGQLVITMHTAQSLFKNPEIKRAVQTGQVALGEIFKANLGNEDPMFELDAIPFFAAGYKEARVLLDVSRPAINERMMKQGLRVLYLAPWPSQMFYTKKPIKSLADLRGLKMRTYNPQTARLAQLMGVVPTTVQATEIPQAFTTGIIDAMFTSPGTGVTTKAWEYTKYVYDTAAWVPNNIAFVNERAFQALPENLKKVVLEQGAVAEKRGWEMSQAENDLAPKQLIQNGMILDPISGTFAAELKKIGEQMLEDWLKKGGADGKKVTDAYYAKLRQQ